MTTQEFINKATVVHGNKYDYSLTKYTNSKIKVIINCKTHGEFKQLPNNHLAGNNCTKCITKGTKLNTENFIKRAKRVHGELYDYSKVEYTDNRTKVIIICKLHGHFLQSPRHHLNGNGCKHCANTGTLDNFINSGIKVHKNKYIYSNSIYVNSKTKLEIICQEHGSFWQIPNAHLAEQGCPLCGELNKRKKFLDEPTLLYFIYLKDFEVYKLGITIKRIGIKGRYSSDPGLKYVVLAQIEFKTGEDAFNLEQTLLKQFDTHKYVGYPILHNGNSEILTKNILKEIHKYETLT